MARNAGCSRGRARGVRTSGDESSRVPAPWSARCCCLKWAALRRRNHCASPQSPQGPRPPALPRFLSIPGAALSADPRVGRTHCSLLRFRFEARRRSRLRCVRGRGRGVQSSESTCGLVWKVWRLQILAASNLLTCLTPLRQSCRAPF